MRAAGRQPAGFLRATGGLRLTEAAMNYPLLLKKYCTR